MANNNATVVGQNLDDIELAIVNTGADGGFEAEDEPTEQEITRKRLNRYIKYLIGLSLIGFVTFIIVDSVTNGYVKNAINDFLAWIEENPIPGFFVFVIVYFVATPSYLFPVPS